MTATESTAAVMPRIVRFPTADALAEGAAIFIAKRIFEAIEARDTCSIALSGGSTPRAVHQALCDSRISSQGGGHIKWSKVRFYFGDERCVPPDSPEANYHMARETLFAPLGIVDDNIYRVRGELPPSEAASHYEAVIRAGGAFDVAIMGMGEDGHTASLFPENPEPTRWVEHVIGSKPPPNRVTLSYPVFNSARTVVFLMKGAGKADKLAEVYHELRSQEPKHPAALIQPASGELFWLVDDAAAARLPEGAGRAE